MHDKSQEARQPRSFNLALADCISGSVDRPESRILSPRLSWTHGSDSSSVIWLGMVLDIVGLPRCLERSSLEPITLSRLPLFLWFVFLSCFSLSPRTLISLISGPRIGLYLASLLWICPWLPFGWRPVHSTAQPLHPGRPVSSAAHVANLLGENASIAIVTQVKYIGFHPNIRES